MGDASTSPKLEQDHLLIVWAFPPSEEAVKRLNGKFPNLKITFKLVDWKNRQAKSDITDEEWLSATHICTMANLPPASCISALQAKDRRLRFIQFTSAGINHVTEHPVYKDTDIKLCTVSGIHAAPISEWVVMSILSEGHRLRQMEAWQREKTWGKVLGTLGGGMRDCVGKRVGVLGYGSIGRQTARVLSTLGMTILAYTASPRSTPESKKDTHYIPPGIQGDPSGELPAEWFSGTSKQDLHDFLAQDLDYLVISIPLTSATTHLIGAEELKILAKSNCFLLNISRGAIIDQPALVTSLKAGMKLQNDDEALSLLKGDREGIDLGIRGAALDVTDPEPLPEDSELWGLENCWVSPHVSAVNPEYWPRALGVLEDNLGREGEGRELVNLVDRGKGY